MLEEKRIVYKNRFLLRDVAGLAGVSCEEVQRATTLGIFDFRCLRSTVEYINQQRKKYGFPILGVNGDLVWIKKSDNEN